MTECALVWIYISCRNNMLHHFEAAVNKFTTNGLLQRGGRHQCLTPHFGATSRMCTQECLLSSAGISEGGGRGKNALHVDYTRILKQTACVLQSPLSSTLPRRNKRSRRPLSFVNVYSSGHLSLVSFWVAEKSHTCIRSSAGCLPFNRHTCVLYCIYSLHRHTCGHLQNNYQAQKGWVQTRKEKGNLMNRARAAEGVGTNTERQEELNE